MGDEIENPQWYALQVRREKERAVSSLLSYKGYDHFLPTFNSRPLFPGYVFCRFDYRTRDRVLSGGSVVTTPGVIRILGGLHPSPIPSYEIEAIRLGLCARLRPELWPFDRGQRVTINGGPLKGITGILIRAEGKQRLVLSIELLQRSVAATIQAEWINPATLIYQPIGVAASSLS